MSADSVSTKNGRYLSALSVWALAFGCVIGWGSFVMPGTTFLPDAGPFGTICGIAISALMVVGICFNYSHLAKAYPDAAGSYIYTKNILGEDHAFLAAWSLELAYISLFWANVTAFILIGRYLIGDALEWGFHYQMAGYDVYCGEVITTLGIMGLFGSVTCFGKKLADVLRTVFAVTLLVSVLLLFFAILIKTGGSGMLTPPFSDSGLHSVQILNVAILAPWLFVGFETVAHSVPETKIAVNKIFLMAALAIFAGMAVYVMLTLCASSGTPAGYDTWADYVADIKNLDGLAGFPVFYNADAILGAWGVRLVGVAAFCALATSVLGFHRAAARIIRIMAEGGLLPERFAETNTSGIPVTASLFVLAVSVPIPFVGRTAVSWNADVSTLSVAIVYAYISICTFLTARGKTAIKISGISGMIFSAVVFFFLLVPNVFSVNVLTKESYFMLAVWSFLGMIYYWHMFRRDRAHRFGKSTVMWLMMLFMLFFSANVWVRLDLEDNVAAIFGEKSTLIDSALLTSSLIQLVIVVIALVMMFSLFSTMLRREKELDHQIVQAEERNKAKTDFLSNMSHDIRTPMNAIVGFTDLALLDTGNRPKVEEYLEKIKASSAHLLSLINDVLEMSRIESGKIELAEERVNLPELLHNLNAIITGQVEAKHQELFMDALHVSNENILCDKLRLNQVLLNLVSNAIKYTPSGGKIFIRIIQKSEVTDGKANYEIQVKDTGIGMTAEFAAKVFEAFEREKTSTVSGIQGTGLGMAITKRIVDLMGGTITVDTAPGEGTEFIVAVTFAVAAGEKTNYLIPDLNGVRALVVDDDFASCDSVTNMLIEMGLDAEWTSSGKEAVLKAKQANERGKGFGVYVIDWKMPDISGIEVARKIHEVLADDTPILLMTAYDWLTIKDDAEKAGVKAFCDKPLFPSELHAALLRVIKKDTANDDGRDEETKTNSPSESFAGKRLLLVDDMMINRQIALAMLELYGFAVEEAENGEEAVAKVSAADAGYYDAVLMDIQMPKMNGYEAAKAIRKLPDEKKRAVPIIAMTANAFDEDKKNALDAGMNGHLAKPIDREKLIETLSEMLTKKND